MTLEERIEAQIVELRRVAELYEQDGALITAQDRKQFANQLEAILKEHRAEQDAA